MLSVVVLRPDILSVIMNCYAKYRASYTEYHAEWYCVECGYSECHYDSL